ncbi:MAG: S8 family serine peptidase [Pyrinomonadaceae bacterium]|nr:S8 family serine peptidase [Pyrinomonadaceae bacterium]
MAAKKQSKRDAAKKLAPKQTPPQDIHPEITIKQKQVVFEAVLKPAEGGQSMFASDATLKAENLDKFRPKEELGVRAARALQELGFTVRHIGTFSISVEGPKSLWEKHFRAELEEHTQQISQSHPDAGEVTYHVPKDDGAINIPEYLKDLVERVLAQKPPIFLGASPLPPRVSYHHLRVPSDIATVLRSELVHREGITGKGILVAMPDTGFYKHPFYAWHGYNYTATLAPDATKVEHDAIGHGTAEAANIFSNAPNIDFVGVKMGANPTLAFKAAADLYPAVMSNSWGYDIKGATLPDWLKPLEAAVIEAVRIRGITVCFSSGNGQYGFPGQMPEVISVGGVYAHEKLASREDDFDLEASNYASSFESKIYPGRRVPDFCGLVGLTPRGIYIMLPVEPGDAIDRDMALDKDSAAGPDKGDGTTVDDGWAVISGTSAACPQIAGVCALIKQVQPGLPPDLVKAVLRASARDVSKGKSAMGEPAGEGFDGATGSGLVDAYKAYKLARSVTPQNLAALPAPR